MTASPAYPQLLCLHLQNGYRIGHEGVFEAAIHLVSLCSYWDHLTRFIKCIGVLGTTGCKHDCLATGDMADAINQDVHFLGGSSGLTALR